MLKQLYKGVVNLTLYANILCYLLSSGSHSLLISLIRFGKCTSASISIPTGSPWTYVRLCGVYQRDCIPCWCFLVNPVGVSL